jgi:hypothetical protein
MTRRTIVHGRGLAGRNMRRDSDRAAGVRVIAAPCHQVLIAPQRDFA